jgi:hypothetical protein
MVAADFAAGKAFGDASAQLLDSHSTQTRAQVVVVQSLLLQRT